MKQNKTHPAVISAKKKMTQRYLISAVALLLCAVVFVLGFIFKPKEKALESETYTAESEVDTYVKSDLTLVSAMFTQDILDENNKVTGERYYILAVDTDGNKFMMSAPREYYESTLKQLENNTTQDIESGKLEILDEDLKVTVYGYVREMSDNLAKQLDTYSKGYESVLFKTTLEAKEKPESVIPFNSLYVAAGFIGIVALCILLTAVSLTAEYGRVKKKHEKA